MSYFRIQRKLTQGSSLKLKPNLSNPHRIRSLESKQSISTSPKKIQHNQLRRMIRKVTFKDRSLQRTHNKQKMEEGMKAFSQKNVTKALQIFKQLRKNGVKSAELSYYIGSCYLNLGKNQASINFLNQCLSFSERFSQNAYLYIAINHKLLSNHKQAIKILEKGTSLFPTFQQGYFYKGKLWMKAGELFQASQAFSKCLKINPNNDLATIFLGDCYRLMSNYEKALQKYKYVLYNGKKHKQLAATREAIILLECKRFQELLNDLIKLGDRGFQNPQVSYYIGVSYWNIGKKHDAVVYFESSLNNSKQASTATKSLKALIRISIEQFNFFQAQHHISRINKLGLNENTFKEWSLFVEGINDLIKRKNQTALESIMKSYEMIQSTENQESHSTELITLRNKIYPYAAYALYLNSEMQRAIHMYEKAYFYEQNKKKIEYSKLMAEGIHFHNRKMNNQAFCKFFEAFQLEHLNQSLFLSCITLIQYLKNNQQQKSEILQKVQKLIKLEYPVQNKSPLFLFYSALIYLYQNRPCLPIIQEAIGLCQQPISQYYFIEALALHNEGKQSQALQSITKAIQLDPGIEQFYRQRSKYYFISQDYDSAIDDCKKAEEMVPDDQQLPLLLAFYYYLNDQFIKAYNYLLKTKPSSGKLKQFEQALQLRLGMYNKLNEIGKVLIALKDETLTDEKILAPIQTFITQRFQYSEFSVYFYHLVLAISYATINQPQKSLNHLFGCLEQIQFLVDERQSKQTPYEVTWQQTQQMLDEVKFNIVVVSLMKQNYEQTENFIQVFLTETQSEQLKSSFQRILALIKDQTLEGQVRLMAEDDYPRISDRFPNFRIKLKKQTLITKLLISYPVKLKFTIAPEFDPAYLLNFDIDKIQYKIPPPWLKTSTKKVNFTNSIRNESIILTESQTSARKQQKKRSQIPLRQRLKLDKQLEEKLKKIIQK